MTPHFLIRLNGYLCEDGGGCHNKGLSEIPSTFPSFLQPPIGFMIRIAGHAPLNILMSGKTKNGVQE